MSSTVLHVLWLPMARGLATGTANAIVSPGSRLIYSQFVNELRGNFDKRQMASPSALTLA